MGRWVFILGLIGLIGASREAAAQAIRLDVQAAPLEEALALLRAQAALDVVYAERQVAERRTTCRYEGDNPDTALDCLLAGTGLYAERVRRRQYVLADAGGAATDAEPPPRRMILGFVADADTGEMLPGAHVYLSELSLGTTTNDAGYFALSSLPAGQYAARISYLGFIAVDTVLTAGSAASTIELRPATLESGEVVVEGQRTDRLDLATPGVVNAPVQELERLPSFPGEPDLFQALQWMPGVRKSGEVNGGLSVRGGAPDQNLYLLDGAPVYHPWHAFSLISTFQTETFKDIKLYRGAFPAEHGGRLAAVLDAEMRDGSRGPARAVAGISMLSGRFLVESGIGKKASVMLAGRRSYIDKIVGREHPVEEDGLRDTLRTGYFFYDASAKLTYRPSLRHRFSVSYYNGEDDLDLRLPFTLSTDIDEWLRPLDLFFEIDHGWGNRLLSARHQYLYSRSLFVTTTLYRSSYHASERVFMRPTDASVVRSEYSVRVRDFGLKTDVDYYPALAHQVRAGVQVVGRDFRSALDADLQRSLGAVDTLHQRNRVQAFEVVGYVQDSWQPAPHWMIQPGLRASLFSGGGGIRFSPRLNVQYAAFPERLVVRGGAGVQWQYLHLLRDRYSYLYDLISNRWVPAGGSVGPSLSWQTSFGLEHYPAAWLTLAADTYARASYDVLIPTDAFQTKSGLEGPGIDVGTLLGQYTPGQAAAFGLELTARAEWNRWRLWLSYAGGRSLSRAQDQGETAFRPAQFDVPRSLQGVAQRQGRHWGWTLSGEWRSGYPLTVPVARYAVGGPLDDEPTPYLYRPEINNGRLPPYFRLDATMAYRFGLLGADFQVQLHVYNVLNRRNIIDRTYDPRPKGAVLVNDRQGLFLLPLLEIQMEI